MKTQLWERLAIAAILCIGSYAEFAQTSSQVPDDAPLENSALVIQHPKVQDVLLS